MIVCENCESARFLNIVRSTTYADDGERVTEIEETIECLHCELEGETEYDLETDSVTIAGGLVRTPERPTTATKVELRGEAQ